jgi:hypothetical protein
VAIQAAAGSASRNAVPRAGSAAHSFQIKLGRRDRQGCRRLRQEALAGRMLGDGAVARLAVPEEQELYSSASKSSRDSSQSRKILSQSRKILERSRAR